MRPVPYYCLISAAYLASAPADMLPALPWFIYFTADLSAVALCLVGLSISK